MTNQLTQHKCAVCNEEYVRGPYSPLILGGVPICPMCAKKVDAEPQMFGAVADGATDDTLAIQAQLSEQKQPDPPTELPTSATCAECKATITGDRLRWMPLDAEIAISLEKLGVMVGDPHRAGFSYICNASAVPAHICLCVTEKGIRVARCVYCARRSPYPAPNPGRSLDERIHVAKLSAPKPTAEPEPQGWAAWATPHDEGP
jgi:hypothetical protein